MQAHRHDETGNTCSEIFRAPRSTLLPPTSEPPTTSAGPATQVPARGSRAVAAYRSADRPSLFRRGRFSCGCLVVARESHILFLDLVFVGRVMGASRFLSSHAYIPRGPLGAGPVGAGHFWMANNTNGQIEGGAAHCALLSRIESICPFVPLLDEDPLIQIPVYGCALCASRKENGPTARENEEHKAKNRSHHLKSR
ncbi:hypothetical protein VUR80DRAFT_3569 [Thermomyces stellatus]